MKISEAVRRLLLVTLGVVVITTSAFMLPMHQRGLRDVNEVHHDFRTTTATTEAISMNGGNSRLLHTGPLPLAASAPQTEEEEEVEVLTAFEELFLLDRGNLDNILDPVHDHPIFLEGSDDEEATAVTTLSAVPLIAEKEGSEASERVQLVKKVIYRLLADVRDIFVKIRFQVSIFFSELLEEIEKMVPSSVRANLSCKWRKSRLTLRDLASKGKIFASKVKSQQSQLWRSKMPSGLSDFFHPSTRGGSAGGNVVYASSSMTEAVVSMEESSEEDTLVISQQELEEVRSRQQDSSIKVDMAASSSVDEEKEEVSKKKKKSWRNNNNIMMTTTEMVSMDQNDDQQDGSSNNNNDDDDGDAAEQSSSSSTDVTQEQMVKEEESSEGLGLIPAMASTTVSFAAVPMTMEEKKSVEKLRSQLKSLDPSLTSWLEDGDLLRYVREFASLHEAFQALRKTCEWRVREIKVEEVMRRDVNAALSKELFWFGRDREGTPVLIMRSALHSPGKFSFQEYVDFMVQVLETGRQELGVGRESPITLLVDRQDSGISNQDPFLVMELVPLLQRHFPGCLRVTYIAPINWFFKFIWNVFGLVLASRTLQRVQLLSDEDFKVTLREHFHEDSLPKYLGGSLDSYEKTSSGDNESSNKGGAVFAS